MAEMVGPGGETRYPLKSLWLELTQKCNLFCEHCYAESHVGLDLQGTMTTDDWVRVIEDAGHLGCKFVQFIGGEPLLHPSIEKLARVARDIGVERVEILSNATILTEPMLSWMSDLNIDVATSVYSSEPRSHDSVTRRQGSWRKTLQNIERMQAAGIYVRAGIIYRDRVADRVGETAEFLSSRGVQFGTDRVRDIGRGGSTSSDGEYLAQLCGACGDQRVCVTNSGEVYPCIMSRKSPVGNVTDQDLASILAGNKISAFVTDLAEQKSAAENGNCTPDCWPHGGCAPHDVCKPHGKSDDGRPVSAGHP